MNQKFKFIDLTHTLSGEIPTWDGGCGFELSINVDYQDCTPPDLFCTQKMTLSLSTGTHIDAPAHAVPGGRTIEKLTLEELVTDCAVIDVSKEADENYMILPEAVEKFEKEHGEIKLNTFIIFYTGWGKRWEDPEKYSNNHKFPSIDEDTAKFLLGRGVAGLGTDTLSADTGVNGFPVHRAILGADKYLVENVANADLLPPTGAKILVLPTKIKNGTEAPIRLIGLI